MKKGFTLIEILVVIVIIGILSSSTIITFNLISKNKKEELKEANIKLLEIAAIKYGEANKNDIKEDYQITIKNNSINKIKATDSCTITVEALKFLGYIDSKKEGFEEIKNSDKVLLYLENNKVKAIYNGSAFNIKLEQTNKNKSSAKLKLTITKGENEVNKNYSAKYYVEESGVTESIPNTKLGITNFQINDLNRGINLITGEIPNVHNVTVTVSNGTITKSKTIKVYTTKDNSNANLNISVEKEDGKAYDGNWTNQNVIIKNNNKTTGYTYEYTLDNGITYNILNDKVSISKEGITNVLIRTTKNGFEDAKGNITIKIDKTKPIISVKAYKRSNTGLNEGIELFEQSTSSNNNNALLIDSEQINNLVNGWYNGNNYPYGILYIFTANDDKSGLKEKLWTYNNEGIYNSFNSKDEKNTMDSNSKNGKIETINGNEGIYNQYLSGNGQRSGKFYIKDKAGNINSIEVRPKIDKEKPKIEFKNKKIYQYNNECKINDHSNDYDDNTWINKYHCLGYEVESIDDNCGASGCYVEKNGKNINSDWTTDGNDDYTAYDLAGNKNSGKIKNVKFDRISPTCSNFEGQSTTWTKGERIITFNCNDKGGSGCQQAKKSYTFYNGEKVSIKPSMSEYYSWLTIRDNAGNTSACDPITLNIYVDNTPPDINCSATGTCDFNKGCDFQINASDSLSGIKKIPPSKYTLLNSKQVVTVEDKVGNKSSCTISMNYYDTGNC